MAKQSCDPTSIHSSIVLLQERFRQLERTKEMRQQKELSRLFSEAEKVQSATAHEPTGLFFHSEFMHLARQPLQGYEYLLVNMQSKHTNYHVNETQNLVNLCSAKKVTHKTNSIDESEVDTSLHL